MDAVAQRGERRAAVRRLAAARLVSVLGSTAAYTALTFAVYDRTGSTTWVSVAVFVTLAATGVLMPLGGLIGDRFDRRRVMIASDLSAAVLFAAVALVDDPAAMIALVFLATLCELPFLPASSAAVPNLAAGEELAWANGRVASASAFGITLGPGLAGALIAVAGPDLAFALNALTFVASAAIVARIRGRFDQSGEAGLVDRGRQQLRAGLVFVRGDAGLRAIVIAEFVAFLGVGVIIVADAPLADQFDVGAVGYGVLIATWGLGMVLGSWLAGRVAVAATEPLGLLVGMAVLAAGIALCAAVPWFAAILVLSVIAGMGNGVANVTRQGIVQRRAPDAVRGRVFAAVEAVGNVSFIGSLGVAGIVVEAIGPQPAYGVGGVVFGLGTVILAPAVLRARGSLSASSPG